MFARLILALLLTVFALPALAGGTCHESPAGVTAMAMPMTHGAHRAPLPDDRPAAAHVCIGCIPPASLAARDLALPLPLAAPLLSVSATRFDPASATPPALPPPRDRA